MTLQNSISTKPMLMLGKGKKQPPISKQCLLPAKLVSKETKVRVGRLFVALHCKYNRGACFKNRSKSLLSLDLLRDGTKRELLQIVALTVEEQLLQNLGASRRGINAALTTEILSQILQTSTKRFLEKYYGSQMELNSGVFKNSVYTRALFDDAELLVKIPFLSILDNKSPIFRTTFSPLYQMATNRILEVLFDNLIITISEAIVRLILNDFSLVRDIQQNWFRSNFLSLRNLERFKNNLAWQDRKEMYIKRPTEIYNNKYEAWVLTPDGFYIQALYANRLFQLLRLKRGALTIINYVEFQDFLLCRIEETIVFASDRTRYLLTYVLGQTIGLIWKGIIETLKE